MPDVKWEYPTKVFKHQLKGCLGYNRSLYYENFSPEPVQAKNENSCFSRLVLAAHMAPMMTRTVPRGQRMRSFSPRGWLYLYMYFVFLVRKSASEHFLMQEWEQTGQITKCSSKRIHCERVFFSPLELKKNGCNGKQGSTSWPSWEGGFGTYRLRRWYGFRRKVSRRIWRHS